MYDRPFFTFKVELLIFNSESFGDIPPISIIEFSIVKSLVLFSILFLAFIVEFFIISSPLFLPWKVILLPVEVLEIPTSMVAPSIYTFPYEYRVDEISKVESFI